MPVGAVRGRASRSSRTRTRATCLRRAQEMVLESSALGVSATSTSAVDAQPPRAERRPSSSTRNASARARSCARRFRGGERAWFSRSTLEDFEPRFGRTSSMRRSSTSAARRKRRGASRALAREFPSVPFFGLAPLRAAEGPRSRSARATSSPTSWSTASTTAPRATSSRQLSFSTRFARRSTIRRARSGSTAPAAADRVALHRLARRPSGADVGARRRAQRHARAPEPIVRRRRRAEPQAHHRSRPNRCRRRAGEESRATTCGTSRTSSTSRRRRICRARRCASSARSPRRWRGLRTVDLVERFAKGTGAVVVRGLSSERSRNLTEASHCHRLRSLAPLGMTVSSFHSRPVRASTAARDTRGIRPAADRRSGCGSRARRASARI